MKRVSPVAVVDLLEFLRLLGVDVVNDVGGVGHKLLVHFRGQAMTVYIFSLGTSADFAKGFSMMITVDVITHRKLVLVKNLYRRAVSQSANDYSTLDRMLSVLTFDLAIETALKAALSALNQSTPLPSELNALIQKCDAALASAGLPTVPDTRQVQDVRKVRNAVQHEARTPNPPEVSDSRTYTRDFLEKFTNYSLPLVSANLGLPALGEANAGGKGSGRNAASQRHNRAMGRAGAAAFHPTRTVAALARKRVIRGLACAAGARFSASGGDITPAAHARTGGRVTQS